MGISRANVLTLPNLRTRHEPRIDFRARSANAARVPVPIPAWGQDRITPFLHFERLPRHADNYLVRAWGPRVNAHLAFDEFTGQPWAPYEGTCILTVPDNDPQTAEVKGILRIPIGAFLRLRTQLVAEIGISEIWGERWHDQHKRIVRVPIGNELTPDFRRHTPANVRQ